MIWGDGRSSNSVGQELLAKLENERVPSTRIITTLVRDILGIVIEEFFCIFLLNHGGGNLSKQRWPFKLVYSYEILKKIEVRNKG